MHQRIKHRNGMTSLIPIKYPCKICLKPQKNRFAYLHINIYLCARKSWQNVNCYLV
jgi:hypothetical protein